MTTNQHITVVGRLTADPELRYTQSGLAVVNFTLASNERTFDRQSGEWKDKEPLFLKLSAWREFAEHIAASLTRGSEVIAVIELKTEKYEDREGNARTAIVGEIEHIGPSLRRGTTTFQPAAPRRSDARDAAPVADEGASAAPVNAPAQPAQQPVPAGVAAAQASDDDQF